MWKTSKRLKRCIHLNWEVNVCGLVPVPLNGHWGRWAAWNACSTSCGKGYQTRSRMCNDPPPQFGGDICEGLLVETQMCKATGPNARKLVQDHELSELCAFCGKDWNKWWIRELTLFVVVQSEPMNIPLSVSPSKEMGNRTRQRKVWPPIRRESKFEIHGFTLVL